MYQAEQGDLSIALVGDVVPTRHLSVFQEPEYLAIRDLLTSADACFANFDSNVHSYLEGYHAQRVGGGTYMTTEPRLLSDIRWLGIGMLACGSSHADDYGPEGVLQTLRFLDEANFARAGLGRHLAEARSPAYFDTAKGRVGLVAATAIYNPGARAGEQRPDTPGYPGVNGIRTYRLYEVSAAAISALRDVGAEIGLDAAEARNRHHGEPSAEPPPGGYNFLGHQFVAAEQPAVRLVGNAQDIEANLRAVRTARMMSDKVIVSLHCHEQGGPSLLTATRRSELDEASDFAREFARRCIDEGADIFVGHGPQLPLPVEIYKGSPIFHGIGTFIFQLETIRYLPHEAYERYGLDERATPSDLVEKRFAGGTRGHMADPLQCQQVFAVCEFHGGALTEIRLHPIELGFGTSRSQRGRPMLASPDLADAIIARLAELSARYGTKIEFDGEIGRIHLG